MQRTDAIKEIIGTHAWKDFKVQLHRIHAEERDKLVAFCGQDSLGKIRQQRGVIEGLERVFNEMIDLERKDEQ